MESRMSYKKAILLLASGIISIFTSHLSGAESELYGFLIGFGYTAIAGGLVGILYSYFKNRKLKSKIR